MNLAADNRLKKEEKEKVIVIAKRNGSAGNRKKETLDYTYKSVCSTFSSRSTNSSHVSVESDYVNYALHFSTFHARRKGCYYDVSNKFTL